MVRRAVRATGRAVVVNGYRALAGAGIASTLMSVSGCYTSLPRTTADVTPSAIISATLTDIGRVALGERIGAEVSAIDGRVVERSDSGVRLLVSQVSYLNGTATKWQGQEVTLRSEDVKSITQRSFSRSRTVVVIGAIVAGIILIVLGANFLGLTSGDPSPDKGGGGPPPES